MTEVTKVLLLLKVANYYCNKGLDVVIIIFGPAYFPAS